jgi:hypothetical protein
MESLLFFSIYSYNNIKLILENFDCQQGLMVLSNGVTLKMLLNLSFNFKLNIQTFWISLLWKQEEKLGF